MTTSSTVGGIGSGSNGIGNFDGMIFNAGFLLGLSNALSGCLAQFNASIYCTIIAAKMYARGNASHGIIADIGSSIFGGTDSLASNNAFSGFIATIIAICTLIMLLRPQMQTDLVPVKIVL